ncbi:MAG: tetratricopeptide repeat protein [Ignavibacteriales bacterium]|nr:tetratricopeptide repeat protein [Ignavibacteriales bacterium]
MYFKLRIKFLLVVLTFFNSIQLGQSDGLNKIDLLLLEENYSAAISKLDSLIKVDSLNLKSLYKLGLAYQGLYQNAKAINVLNKAHNLDTNNVNVILSLGNSYVNLSYLDKAENYYNLAYKKDSTKISIAFKLADVHINGSKFQKAAVIYQKLLTHDTSNSFLYKKLGYCAMKIDSLNLSLKYYQKALELNSSDASTSVQMAAICYKQDKLDSALQYVNFGLQVYPQEPNFNKLKGDILFKKGNTPEAKEYYLKVISLGDSSAQIYQKLGFCYYFIASAKDSFISNDIYREKFQNFYKALEAFEKSYQKEKDNRITCYYAGIANDKVGYFDKAIYYLNETLKLSLPDNLADIYTYLGRAYQVSQHYTEAIDSCKKAMFYKPEQKEFLFYIGLIYDDMIKDNKEALKYYQDFLNEKENTYADLKQFAREKIKALNKR